jgi:fungal STAND N-terminal Goodbye domain
MSSTGQAASSTSNVQLIVDALADYAKVTGIDLSNYPLAATLEQSRSPEAILQLLQGREKAFKEYRDDNPRLIRSLGPVVKVLHAFSGTHGEAISVVSHKFGCLVRFLTRPRQIPFPVANAYVGIDALLDVRSLGTSSASSL